MLHPRRKSRFDVGLKAEQAAWVALRREAGIARYKRVFGVGEQVGLEVVV